MIRVKNEGNYLLSSVKSIIEHVDEVVIVDNNSKDYTPKIISKLKRKYPDKIRSYYYRYNVACIGEESRRLIAKNKNTPNHLKNYYNWCLDKCSNPYILKWDGDMIATNNFYSQLVEFKYSKDLFLKNVGLNIFPSLRHSIMSVKNKKKLANNFYPECFDSYLNDRTGLEFRLFPKKFSKYTADYPYLENFYNPLTKYSSLIRIDNKITFLHLKFCKLNAYENIDKNIILTMRINIKKGNILNDNNLRLIREYKIKNYNKVF